MQKRPEVAIIILNWNNWKDTIECIESLKNGSYSNYKLIIVDNASSNNSAEIIKNRFPECILIKNSTNIGFAEGNNAGIRYAINNLNPQYILLINNDTVAAPDSIARLVDLMQNNPKIGAVQPKIIRKDNSQIIDSVGQEIFSYGTTRDIWFGQKDEGQFNKSKEIFGACAAAALYRTQTLKETGIFNGKFFILLEDVDLSWRIRLAGYKIVYTPNTVIQHKRGISNRNNRNNNKLNKIRGFYAYRNGLYIIIEYYPLIDMLFFLPVHIYRFLCMIYYRLFIKDIILKFLLDAFKKRRNIRLNKLLMENQKIWITKVPIITAYKELFKKHWKRIKK